MAVTTSPSLVDRDLRHTWHPFTQMKNAAPPLPIERAKGAYLYTTEGKRYFDAISSWWVNLHGHGHPHIVEAIVRQADKMDHIIFAGCTHEPAVQLSERLLPLLPGKMARAFFSDCGSAAVEIGLKMAIQAEHNRNPNTKRTKVIALKGAYHGDTFGAMAVSDRGPFSEPFWKHLFPCESIDPPVNENSLHQLKRALEDEKAVAFIFEPLVQGAGGMVVQRAELLDQMLGLCKEAGVLTIADEVMTGFGRTGTLFACERLTNEPDIVCVAKGITGGTLPLAVTACSETVYKAFLSDDKMKALYHGHSYCANAIACAASLASLDLTLSETCTEQRRAIEEQHRQFAESVQEHSMIKNCDVVGTILRMEIETGDTTSYFSGWRDQLYSSFLEHGVLLRPLGNVVYILPPYCSKPEDLAGAYHAITETLERLQ